MQFLILKVSLALIQCSINTLMKMVNSSVYQLWIYYLHWVLSLRMSKSSTASVSKNLALLPAKSAWSRGLLCQQWCQVLTLNPQHFLLLLRLILIVLALLVKMVLLKVISLLSGSAVTFGSIYDALSQISTSPTSAPIIKLSEGVKLSRTVPATAPTSGVWRSSPGTGKRPGLDWTMAKKDRNSQDWKRLQPQSGLQSVAISKNPGLTEDRLGPVWTSLRGKLSLFTFN